MSKTLANLTRGKRLEAYARNLAAERARRSLASRGCVKRLLLLAKVQREKRSYELTVADSMALLVTELEEIGFFDDVLLLELQRSEP